MGPERTAPGRGGWDASIVIFKLFGLWHFSQCLGSKSVLCSIALGKIRDLGCPTAPSGLQGKAKAQDHELAETASSAASKRRRADVASVAENTVQSGSQLDAFAGSPRTHGRAAVPPLRPPLRRV